MITATRPAGCPCPSVLLKTPCLPGASPRRAGHAPSVPVDVPAGYRAPWRRWPAGVLAAEGTRRRKARAALRTGAHPVGHETGPVVYWVPGPFKAQPSPARVAAGGQPGAGLRSNLGVGPGGVNLAPWLRIARAMGARRPLRP